MCVCVDKSSLCIVQHEVLRTSTLALPLFKPFIPSVTLSDCADSSVSIQIPDTPSSNEIHKERGNHGSAHCKKLPIISNVRYKHILLITLH